MSRFFKVKQNRGMVEAGIWRLESNGQWYLKYPGQKWEPRKGPWGYNQLATSIKFGKNTWGSDLIEYTEAELFMESL